MKKAISLTLIAILFLALFAGCNTYRRPVQTGNTVDGRHHVTAPGFQYRTDGRVTNGGRVTPGTARTDGHHVTRGMHTDGHHMTHGVHTDGHHATRGTGSPYRYGGAMPQGGNYGDRPDGYTTARPVTDGAGTATPRVPSGGRTAGTAVR